MRVLCVCLGNICRSPAAEGILRQLAPDWQVDSAGTSDWHIGDPPYGPMQAAAQARGLDLSDLRARQLEAADFTRFDLILAMDAKNRRDILARRPAGATAEVAMFMDRDVPDPYYTRDFDGCLDLLQAGAKALVQSL